MHADFSLFSSIFLGIALSACCGFRVFIPLLATSIGAFNNWVNLSPDMQWIAQWPAIICFSTASIIEIGAYYIPFLDNILDTIATPLAIIAGTLLATSIIPLQETAPVFRWGIGFLAGGTTAGTIQLGTGLVRLFSTKATVGAGNPLIASAENTAAVLGSILSFIVPVVVAILLLLLVLWVIFRSVRRLVRREESIY